MAHHAVDELNKFVSHSVVIPKNRNPLHICLWNKHVIWRVTFIAAILYGLAVARLSSEPTGLISAYAISCHEASDVALFRDGKVILKTCCGDWPWGTYERDSRGKWIWHMRVGTKQIDFDTLEIESSLFTVRVESINGLLIHHTLRRRLFQSWLL